MSKINLLDYKPEELQFISNPARIITHIFKNEDGTVSLIFHKDDRYYVRTIDNNGTDMFENLVVYLRELPFIFPSGIGEAVGKSFKTRDGRKAIVTGDDRWFDPSVVRPLRVALYNSDRIKLTVLTEVGKWYTDGHYYDDLVGYWTEGE